MKAQSMEPEEQGGLCLARENEIGSLATKPLEFRFRFPENSYRDWELS